jgi:pimeloyl-ACP methyl ester carboxylesterase
MNLTVRSRQLRVLVIALITASSLHSAPHSAPVVQRWRLGSVELRSCDTGSRVAGPTIAAWCADFAVPENRAAPDGRQIKLHLAIIKSGAQKPASELLVYLAGGPGAAATEDYPSVAPAFADLRSRHHLLLIDQRGTGRSNPLSCKQADGAEDFVGQSAGEAGDGLSRAELQKQVRACVARLASRADPRFYTTGDAVADLEAVRLALGGPPLNLVGVSYGTRVAQQYAEAYPSAVRSVVLDSAVPNSLVLGSEHAQNMEQALKARFAVCTRNQECNQRFGDPYTALTKLRLQLKAAPVTVKGRDPLTNAEVSQRFGASDLAVGVRLFAYNPATAALLPLAVHEALQGNFQPLLGQEQLITKGLAEQLTDGMGLSVSCAEDADLLHPQPEDANTLLGTSLVDYTLTSCEIWPRGQRRAGFHQSFKSNIPTLVLAGEFDPVTPARYGQEIVAASGNARLLTLKGQGHGVMTTGCTPKLLREFIERLQPRTLDARCLETLGDTPAYLDFNGAAP